MLLAVTPLLAAARMQDLLYAAIGNREQPVSGPHQQRVGGDQRQRQAHLEAATLAGFGTHGHGSAQAGDAAPDRVQTDSASRQLGGCGAGGKVGPQYELAQLRFGERLTFADQLARRRDLPNPGPVEPGAVVAQAHQDVIALTLEFEPDLALGIFSRADSIRFRFDTVVDGVAQHVHQRVHQVVDHVAVHHGLDADALERHFFPRGTACLAHVALQSRNDGLHRDHARVHDGLLGFSVEPPLLGEHVVQGHQVRFHRAPHLARVGSRLHQPAADGVQLVVLVHLQRIELHRSAALLLGQSDVPEVDDLLELRAELLQQRVLVLQRPALIHAALHPLVHLAREYDDLAHQAKQLVHQVGGHPDHGSAADFCSPGGGGGGCLRRLRPEFGRRRCGGRRGDRRFGPGGRNLGAFVVDAVGPVEHRLQHAQTFRRCRALAHQRLGHHFQAVRRVLQHFAQRRAWKHGLFRQGEENVLEMMGQIGDSGDAYGIGRAFERVRHALRHLQLVHAAFSGAEPLNGAGKLGGLRRKLLQQAVEKLGIDVVGKRQRNVLDSGAGLPRLHVLQQRFGHGRGEELAQGGGIIAVQR